MTFSAKVVGFGYVPPFFLPAADSLLLSLPCPLVFSPSEGPLEPVLLFVDALRLLGSLLSPVTRPATLLSELSVALSLPSLASALIHTTCNGNNKGKGYGT